MRKLVNAVLMALAIVGCSPTQPTPTTVATTKDAPRDTSGIVRRFTDDIWPAIAQYGPYQAAANKFRLVVDPAVLPHESQLTNSVEALGGAGYDGATQTTSSHDDLRLVATDVTGVNGSKATLTACYSYVYSSYVNIADKKDVPRSSEATVELANVNNAWYLHSITNDHIVPGCSSPKA
ncbi:hypothetical protein [Mycobacteroides abscessus]|uniref:hypothetical protein n=1 Tax=Mycobacteroides abscessus TaxID=36809 RepID=UPI00092C3CAD|nr:hypothetical protein [Mycobacteroides abscessus]SIA36776.1 Uncharacterised protein [Mycobacteroides abscessus subsp. abscessus]SIA40559.1 Uncharacterised protein [Mycobacteroides abscessus subsp. abscessus]SIA52486.1 Uncharacterised protein [Mycobacteroides abscessus subsp. abscessus]SIA56490.1 Uncharacterised protein [Mycobacteroides abscessus subsp. abscessus]SIA81948.1 Uncharacterised protein [Mycobacteroides abscessus subsp. abscessus]